MTGVIAAHWSDQNETRKYPLSENATVTDQRGRLLPSNILVDLNVRYPSTFGAYPFVSSVTVTGTLVSVTLAAATDTSDSATITPLGVVSLALPIQAGRNYPVQPQSPGVGGWLAFGSGVFTAYNGLFNAVSGLLAPRACRMYALPPVTGLSKQNSAVVLTGVVKLQAQSPLAVTGQIRNIQGVDRTVAVIGLVQPPGTNTSIFSQFTGPCGNRPESQDCGPAAPIEFLSAVGPNCDGNITVQLNGCTVLASAATVNGVVLDCALGLIDACPPKGLPSAQGQLSNQQPDLCESESFSIVAEPEPLPPIEPPPEPPEHSESIEIIERHLPHIETFDHDAREWQAALGGFGLIDDDAPDEPEYASMASETLHVSEDLHPHRSMTTEGFTSSQNIIIWHGGDVQTLHRRYTAAIKLIGGVGGASHNGGVVVNYRPVVGVPGSYTWYLCGIDYDTQQMGIWHFDGNTLNLTSAFASLISLKLGIWYTMQVTIEPAANDNVTIDVHILGQDGLEAEVSLTTNRYLPDAATAGFRGGRAAARFSYLLIEEEA